MTAAQQLRQEVLLQLYGAGSLSLSPAQILREAKRGGLEAATSTDIANTLYFLKGQGFCVPVTDPASGDTRHQITSAGILQWESTQQ